MICLHRSRPFLAYCAIALFAVSAGAQKSAVQPADIANLKRVEVPRISPDGKLIAFTVDTPVAAGKHRDAHIWLVPADHSAPARPFAYSGASESSPDWSPDGAYVAFLSDRPNPLGQSDHSPYQFALAPNTTRPDIPAKPDTKLIDPEHPGMQLWLIALNGGEAAPLTYLPGGIRTFKWSPDGKSIAFLRSDTDSKEEHDRKEAKNDETHVDANYRFSRLWIYDLASHQTRLLTSQDMNIDTLDWSPDGKTIVSRVSPTPRLDDFWRVSKVTLFDVATGAITRTLEEHSGYEPPAFSHDGDYIAFSRFTKRTITDMHFVMRLADGKETRLEDKLPGTIGQMLWVGPSHRLLLAKYVAGHTEAVEVDAADSTVTPLSGISVTSEEFHTSSDGHTLTFLGDSPSAPHEVYAYANGKTEALTSTNPQVANWSLGTQREITWTNPKDHRTVHGVVVLPPDYQAGTRYKTVVHIHGGPEEAWTIGFNGNWYNYATMLASHGYVVLLPNPRGSDGQGPDFTEANFQDWGGGDFGDIMAGVDYLIAQGITDPDRMVVGGWSFGGFMTSWTVTHTDRFKAGMVGAAVTDLYSMATTTDISPSFEDGYFGALSGNFEVYDKHSPVRFVANCHTPVLVLHGEADPRVPLSQGQEFYHALHFLGKDAVMITYPREPHIFTEREHQIDSLSRILAWYDSHTGK
jgi:dipeptidyl aminopeptidase/acylaminoacyl peptidase